MITRSIPRLTAALACALLAAACGGGGGGADGGAGGTPGGVVLNGKEFHQTSYSYLVNGGVPDGIVIWAQLTFTESPDGDPVGISIGALNENGVVDLGSTDGTIPRYEIDDDGFFSASSLGFEFMRGGFSRDTRVGLVANTLVGSPPRIMCMVRKNGSFANASLAGVYHIAIHGHQGPSTLGGAVWGKLTFDGAGAISGSSLSANADGVVTPSLAPVGGSYGVLPDGRVVATVGADSLSGGMLEGGDFLALTGETTDGLDVQEMLVGFPVGSGLDETAFDGTYWLVGMKDAVGGTATTSIVGTVMADGAGNIDVVTIENEEGSISGTEGPGTYVVSPDGSFALSGGDPGAISPDGRFGFVSGGAAGNSPQLFVFVRQ